MTSPERTVAAKRLRAVTLFSAGAGMLAACATLQASEPLRYNRDIRPILSDNCFYCHGPDANRRKSGLRLDIRDDALKPAESGEIAIVPGNPEASALVARIESADRDELMPPPKSHKKLTPAQKETLKRWIREGAAYEKHWAFTPVGTVEPPVLQNRNENVAIRNPIDAFVFAHLETEGLTLSPEADRPTLIRRLSLDLTGLPPTLEEVDAFLADDSPQAYDKVVDRLLASPRYGERMAVDWLDAARFADSNGYQVDRDREMYAWRDWVIRAFNENKPFDQFTIEQIAGDLLSNATLDQRIATGFHRNHMINEEGGVIPEEFLAEYTADRVETTGAVWLGQTFNCARCHDHKFDPFTQRDFYSLKAFFHNVAEKGKGDANSNIRLGNPPFVKLPAPELEAKLAKLKEELAEANQERAKLAEQSAAKVDEFAARLATAKVDWQSAEIPSASGGEEEAVVDTEQRTVRIGTVEGARNLTMIVRTKVSRVTALRLEFAALDGATTFSWSELTVTRVVNGKKQPLKLRAAAAGGSMAANEIAKVLDNDRRTNARVPVTLGRNAQAVFELETALALSDTHSAEFQVVLNVEAASVPTSWRVSTTATDPELLAPPGVVAIAGKEAAARTAAERKSLAEFAGAREHGRRELDDRIAGLTKQITVTEGEVPTTMVMEEMAMPRPTFILVRGAYDKPGQPVTAATPEVLPPMDADLPRNRLGLARWLVDPRNPLPARVTVNRFWQSIFGAGLVKTSEDFGAQGEPPSHPELLDWLAGEFVRRGWDMKAMMRMIVTSATYRQSSRLTPALRERDPENRLLARGARFRLPAEFVRDQALAASGLLTPAIGGPSRATLPSAGIV